MLHTLTTHRPFPEFIHLRRPYSLSITFCIIDDSIDIHVAVIKPDASALTMQVSPNIFSKLISFYKTELEKCSRDEICHLTTRMKKAQQ
jgi:hypothetical protein